MSGIISNNLDRDSGLIKAAAVAFDGTDVRNDLLGVALKNAITENRAAHNLPNTHIQIFQDDTANALACSGISANAVGNNGHTPMSLTHVMTSGTTSETTFKVRSGTNSGTTYFNSRSGGREFGGVLTSSIVITEYE